MSASAFALPETESVRVADKHRKCRRDLPRSEVWRTGVPGRPSLPRSLAICVPMVSSPRRLTLLCVGCATVASQTKILPLQKFAPTNKQQCCTQLHAGSQSPIMSSQRVAHPHMQAGRQATLSAACGVSLPGSGRSTLPVLLLGVRVESRFIRAARKRLEGRSLPIHPRACACNRESTHTHASLKVSL